ncbi:hypothetical protein [Protofrankia symbiont of Coriaria ruscifolia]|uniref:hypothetical protein n=1 Tax=Protofrankia symbiont of Coriaria ruscifolia TaxID=1306542 RepID=UPI001041062C|nr:hypothetical protein [Protofrankia symbiont of Coriaria ruscifolia]
MSTPLYQLKAEFFKTLGHPVRIRVLELLAVARTILTGVLTGQAELLQDLRAVAPGAGPPPQQPRPS